jgi:hypothetical protein
MRALEEMQKKEPIPHWKSIGGEKLTRVSLVTTEKKDTIKMK